jgi:hypothetical protein
MADVRMADGKTRRISPICHQPLTNRLAFFNSLLERIQEGDQRHLLVL